MIIFTAVICVALGVALSETYAWIRRRAEKDAYERGYQQAKRETELQDDMIERYAITIPRRLRENESTEMQSPFLTSCDDTVVEEPPVGQAFMDRLRANGQATAWLGKEEQA